jgi:outer membrane protein
MYKFIFIILVTFVTIAGYSSFAQQRKGAYKPTKYDSVKKLIPPQYYGNAREAKRADSIAKAAALQKELELKEQEARNKKLAEQKMIEEKRLLEEKRRAEKKRQTNKKDQSVENRPNIIKNPPVQKQKPAVVPVKANPEKKVLSKPTEVTTLKQPIREKQVKGIWTLEECIEYAKLNNLQVAEIQLDERYAQLLYEESKNSRYPDLNAALQAGKAFGRNIDPATNQFVSNRFNYNTAGLYSQTLLFGWFQKKYQLEKNELEVEAAAQKNNQLKNDISLNITTGFLRLLQAREQVKMAGQAVKNTAEFMESNSRAGHNDYTTKIQLSSMLASDSALYAEAAANERLALLQLKALMNIDFEEDFNIKTTENDAAQMAHYFSLPDAETLFQKALQEKNLLQYHQLRLLSAKKSLDIAKAMQYPQLSLYANLGSVYSSNVKDITAQTYEGESAVGYVNIAGSSYPVTSSQYNYSLHTRSFSDQYSDHFRAGIGLGLTMPLLNGYSARANIQKAKIGLVSEQIKLDDEKLKLKQELYRTYEEAKAASQKYIAYKKAADEAAKLLDALNKRDNGEKEMFFETERAYNIYQLNQDKASSAKYDLLFKLKMLDYYTGTPLKM